MDRGAVIFCAALFIVLAALTSVASSKNGQPDTSAAVASAIRHELTNLAGADAIEGKGASFGPIRLCVGSKVPLAVDAIARDLAGTIIKVVPDDDCTSETVHGDFGMFSAVTSHYVGGEEAAHLKVVGVSCLNTSTCIVDIDRFGGGDRYVVRRRGQTWAVVERQMRWVV